MSENEKLINDFYTAFKQKNFAAMQSFYADDATFSDQAFQNLDAQQVKAMWKMLCLRGKDLELEYSNVRADENHGSCDWVANYTFSKTGRKVENRIHAAFELRDGKIVKHVDSFDFYKWIKQALGVPGLLLGWTPFMQNKVRASAMQSLREFMDSEK